MKYRFEEEFRFPETVSLDKILHNKLTDLCFTFNTLGYAFSIKMPSGKRKNYRGEISGMCRLIRYHKEGNYGRGREFFIINNDGCFHLQYYGDGSARKIHLLEEPSADLPAIYDKLRDALLKPSPET